MDTAPNDNGMSADQVRELSEKLHKIYGILLAVQIIIGILASALIAFAVVSYQQSTLQRDTLSRLVQQVEDMPKENGPVQTEHEKRISRLEAEQETVLRKLGL